LSAPTFYFQVELDAFNACELYYDKFARDWCDGFYIFELDKDKYREIGSPIPQVGNLAYGTFKWNNRCIESADANNISMGHATYIGECMSTAPDIQIVRLLEDTELAEITGLFIVSWVLGYVSGQVVRNVTKAVEHL
jgi:hypothetical protein